MKLSPGSLPLIFLMFAMLVALSTVTATGDGLSGGTVHNLDKVTDYATIAAAVADADEGNTIAIDSGTYQENNIAITKSITLTGSGPTKPVIDGTGNNGISVSASYVHITGINVTNCYNGIYFNYGSDDNEVRDCNVTRCSNVGIYLYYADDNNFLNNNLTLNNIGLLIEYAEDNTIVGNNVSGNTYRGIRFRNGGSYNVFYRNVFMKNSKDVDYNEGNSWDSGEPLSYQYHGVTYTGKIGNYWENYEGVDSNNDGIGDTPMIVFRGDGSNIYDNYPMMLDLPVPPKASFTQNATSDYAPFGVKFTDTSSRGPTSWHWEFGDGATADVQNPVHVYTTPGTYLVNLTATNAFGSSTAKMADTEKLIVVLQPLPSPLKAKWLKTYPMSGVSGSNMYGVTNASDGGFALVGYTHGANSGLRLIKADAGGNQVWNQVYTTYGLGSGSSLVPEDDGGFTFAGESSTGLLAVTRTQADGSVVWTTTLANTNGVNTGHRPHVGRRLCRHRLAVVQPQLRRLFRLYVGPERVPGKA